MSFERKFLGEEQDLTLSTKIFACIMHGVSKILYTLLFVLGDEQNC